MSGSGTAARGAALLAVLVVVAVAAVLVLDGGGTYTIHARFADAGLLVPGGRVQVAGHRVGSIDRIRLTADGQADVALTIDDDGIVPLHAGTRVGIRAVGQAGIANRYIDLAPGAASAPPLPDGATLGAAQTRGIVNLDALLDSFGPVQRRALAGLIDHSAEIYAGSGAPAFNRMLGRFPPALAELSALYGELASDGAGLTRLIRTAATATEAIASRRRDLVAAVGHTATALGAIASERDALSRILVRAPAVLRQAGGTLARTGAAVTALRPALRDLPAAAGPLGTFLGRLRQFLPRAQPVVADLVGQLPALRATLDGIPPIVRPAVRGLISTGGAMRAMLPIFKGFRLYGSDLILGALVSVGGIAAGPYDARGHYAKVNFVQNAQTVLSGKLAPLLTGSALVPGLFSVRTKIARRCPGGNVPPAPDGSSPWLLGAKYCDPAADTPASVNEP